MSVPSPSDRELLSLAAARRLLERAGEIDSESTSVDTLREAAREAGISEAAFDAALAEMRGRMAAEPPVPPASRRRFTTWLVAGTLLFAAMAFIVIPRAVGPVPGDLTDHEIAVQCLPMEVVQGIARTTLRDRDNLVQVHPGSRVLRVRATQAQVTELWDALNKAEKGQASCANTSPGR